MARRRSLEDILERLNELRTDPTAESSIRELRGALGGKNSFAVAKAASIAGEFEIGELTSELAAAFERFMTDPARTDKNCQGKAAIAEALYRIGYDGENLFLQGIRHVQREPVYGGSVDTACELRGWCALGLVRMQYEDAAAELVQLLADPEPQARIGALRALAYADQELAEPLLRYKALIGDEEPDVFSECLSALVVLAPERSVEFVSRFLKQSGALKQELAALALGGSRAQGAFENLKDWWEQTYDRQLRRSGLIAIAALRREEAIAFLLSLVCGSDRPVAREALEALEIYLDDERMRKRLRAAVERRPDLDLNAATARKLGVRPRKE